MFRRIISLLLAAVAVVCMATAVHARDALFDLAMGTERILSYDVRAVLDRDASMRVTETIRVLALGKDIRRGILRTYPIRQVYDGDQLRRFDVKIESVKCDGKPEAYHHSDSDEFMAGIAIGSANKLISHGEHTYEVTYRTTGHVRFFDDHDEIYFNAVGTDNQFIVDSASFELVLPEGAKTLTHESFTGAFGSKSSVCRAVTPTRFETLKPLNPGEAMTVVISWPKGVVTQPKDTILDWLGQHRLEAYLIVLLLAFAIAAAIVMTVRMRLPKVTTYPLFHGPDNFSPALAAFTDNGFSSTPLMLQADALWLGVCGKATLSLKQGNDVLLKKCDCDPVRGSRLSEVMRQLADQVASTVFRNEDELLFSQTNGSSKTGSAWSRLRSFYLSRSTGCKDENNFLSLIVFLACAAGIVALLMTTVYPMMDEADWFVMTLLVCFAYVPPALAVLVWENVPKSMSVIAILWGALLSFCLEFDPLFIIVMASLVLLPAVVFRLIGVVPSFRGASLKAKAEGLKMYIRAAEADRLRFEAMGMPKDSVEQYEAILPYAVALGCAKEWEERYSALLRIEEYRPEWIVGSDHVTLHNLTPQMLRSNALAAVSSASAGDAIKSAIRSSSTRSYSSSGSGSWRSSGGGFSRGGGHSGGGSGGGGVRGW